jgi:hypothetical protein
MCFLMAAALSKADLPKPTALLAASATYFPAFCILARTLSALEKSSNFLAVA